MAEARAARRAARATKDQKAARRDRPATRSVVLREIALGLVCLQIAIFILAFDPSVINVFDLTKATYTHALAWGLFGVMVAIALREGVRVPVSPLFLALYAVVAVEALTTLTAENRYIAVYGEVGRYLGLTTHAVLALTTVAIAVALDYPRRAPWLGWMIGIAAAIAGLYAIQQALGGDPVRWLDADPRVRPFSSFGNPDFYGQFLAVVAIAAIAVLLFTRPGQFVIALAAGLALMSVALMLVVQTRGSFVGIVAGAAAIAPLWLRRAGLTRRALLRFGVASLATLVGVVVMLAVTPLGSRLVDIGRGIGLRDRVLLYQSAFQIFLDHPVLGVGFENFAVAYPRYQQAEWFAIAGPNTTNTSAHDWVLHVAATTGIVGLAANLALVALFVALAWRRARDAEGGPVLVAFAAAAAFYGSGLVLPGTQSIQWIPWACLGVALASELPSARPVRFSPPIPVPGVVLGLVATALALAGLTELGALDASRAGQSAESAIVAENGARAVAAGRTATTTDPGRAVYWNDLGRALELIPDLTGARAAYREATSRSPYTPAFWWNLGRMEAEFAKRNEPGARDAAYAAMQRAITANPRNPETYDRFAEIQLALGDADGAIATLREGVAATDWNALRITLARRLLEAGRLAEARLVIREALDRDPANGAALDLQRQAGGP